MLGSFVFVRTVGAVDAVQAKVSCDTAVLCIVASGRLVMVLAHMV